MLDYNLSLQEFAELPDTLSMLARDGIRFQQYLAANPQQRQATTNMVGGHTSTYIDKRLVPQIEKDIGVIFRANISYVVGLMGFSDMDASGISAIQNQPFLGLQGTGTLIGIIDTGIDYTQQQFRNEDGSTRIKYIWDQSIPGSPPKDFFVGTEYSQEQINAALSLGDPFSAIPHRDDVGHGTFLASVSGGRDIIRYQGAAPKAEYIIVKLKEANEFYRDMYMIPDSQRNVYESNSVVFGLEYIYRKSLELDMPASICLGIGTNMGGHDGFSIFEEYLEALGHKRGICVCAAAGNESQARHHVEGTISQTGHRENIEVSVRDRGGDIYMNIWNSAANRLSVAIQSPSGGVVDRIPAKVNSTFTTSLVLENSRVSVQYAYPVEGKGAQVTMVSIQDATPGIWEIIAYGDIISDGEYHAWLPVIGLVEPGIIYLRASPNYTVVVPGTSDGVITVGAYDSLVKGLYAYSSWGPSRLEAMMPDLVAPGVNVQGLFPQGYGSMSGTSVSAAITAGACALLLQWGIVQGNEPYMNTYRIKSYLIQGCEREGLISYPNEEWGYGRLNLLNTFEAMRGQ